MARGAEGKARRKNEKKEARAKEAERLLEEKKAGDTSEGNTNEFDSAIPFPGPPSSNVPDSSSSEEDEADASEDKAVEKAKKRAARRVAAGGKKPSADAPPPSSKQGIKPLPLVMLILLTGSTLLPALLYAGDYMGAFLQKNHIMGSLGYKLGIGPSPKKRVLSFYEKHDPTKIESVPTILAKHYGDYPKLIKKLERKYGDYGYFIDWEKDEAPMNLAFDQLKVTRDYLGTQWTKYAPQFAKTGARNMRYNLTTLYRKGRRVWKKSVWPILEPVFGVPDGAAAQKRKDAKEARASAGPGKRRKKNTEFRDD